LGQLSSIFGIFKLSAFSLVTVIGKLLQVILRVMRLTAAKSIKLSGSNPIHMSALVNQEGYGETPYEALPLLSTYP